MRAVQTEVIDLGEEHWTSWVNRELPRRNLKRVLLGDHAQGRDFVARADQSLTVSTYSEPIDSWKSRLFHQVEVAITGTLGAVAETGSLLLWPDASEPRLMSLVPPVHIALLDRNRIFGTLAEVMASQNWAHNMPTNALLISGPSKTADIEQTLAYGIHGPQQLVVLLTGEEP
jgi:L-lactate dehydrogenase complex protein LldG